MSSNIITEAEKTLLIKDMTIGFPVVILEQVCEVCYKKFETRAAKRSHFRTHHKLEESFCMKDIDEGNETGPEEFPDEDPIEKTEVQVDGRTREASQQLQFSFFVSKKMMKTKDGWPFERTTILVNIKGKDKIRLKKDKTRVKRRH